jgi:phosphatidate cytidylyltransferase
MLVWRLALGAVFIGGMAALCWADYHAQPPGMWLVMLAALLALAASNELVGMMAAGSFHPAPWPIYLGNLPMVVANWYGHFDGATSNTSSFALPAVAFVIAVLAVFVVEMVRYREPGRSTAQLATAVLALAYVGWLTTFLIQLRFVGGNRMGMAALVTLILVVKMCDIGAYTVGRLIGRHKMTPRLSSGKTVEGLIGGLIFASIASWCAFSWLVPAVAGDGVAAPRAYAWLIFGLLAGIAGVLGDLAESLLKRDLGCKDSSTWMPGFGGVLDVLDSLLFSAPVAYIAWRWLLFNDVLWLNPAA